MAIFKVAAHTGDNNNGYIEYDTETKELGVHLNDDVMNEFDDRKSLAPVYGFSAV